MTNPEHAKQLEEFGIKPFDLVVVNLYPFADTVRSGANEADTIEKIDIGGPSMVRGAAKNHAPWPSSPTRPIMHWSPPAWPTAPASPWTSASGLPPSLRAHRRL